MLSFFGKRPRREIHGGHTSPVAPSTSAPQLPGVAPSDFVPGAQKRWYEAFVAPFVDGARNYRISLLLALIALFEGLALWQLIPLRERVPYLAEWDETEGKFRETGQFRPLSPETVQQRQIDFHARNWTRWILTIDSQTKSNLERASTWVRGAGVNELVDWIEHRDRPGERQAKDPDYTRSIEKKIAITYGQGKTLFLHLELVERRRGVETTRLKKLLQIDYDLVPDQYSDDNPIGLAIIHFTIGDE